MSGININNSNMSGTIIGNHNKKEIKIEIPSKSNDISKISGLLNQMYNTLKNSSEIGKKPKDHALKQVKILDKAVKSPAEKSKQKTAGAINALETVNKFLSPTGKLFSEMNKLLSSIKELIGLPF